MHRDDVAFAVLTEGRPGRMVQNILSWIREIKMLDYDNIYIFDNSGTHTKLTEEIHYVINSFCTRYYPEVSAKAFNIIKMSEHTLPIPLAHDYIFKYLNANYKYAVFLEDDHFFTQEINMQSLIELMDFDPDIVQIAFNRNPLYEDEINNGGILQAFQKNQKNLTEKTYKQIKYTERPEHFIFSGSLINTRYLDAPMPEDKSACESFFGDNIVLKYPNAKFAWYGHINDLPIMNTYLSTDGFVDGVYLN